LVAEDLWYGQQSWQCSAVVRLQRHMCVVGSTVLLFPVCACCTVSELFGVSHATHVHPLRTLRVHLHRLAALQLWSVAKYAAGRGVDQRQLKRLGMAAWLSDGNSASTNISGQVSIWTREG
jgi:hypothetical protein